MCASACGKRSDKRRKNATQSNDDDNNKCDGVDNKIKTKQHAQNSRTEMYTKRMKTHNKERKKILRARTE